MFVPESALNAPRTAAPPLFISTIQRRHIWLLTHPIVLEDAMVRLSGAAIDTTDGVPVAMVTFRKETSTGFVPLGSLPSEPLIAIVNALVATVALIPRFVGTP